jgi:hypothetical protein
MADMGVAETINHSLSVERFRTWKDTQDFADRYSSVSFSFLTPFTVQHLLVRPSSELLFEHMGIELGLACDFTAFGSIATQ